MCSVRVRQGSPTAEPHAVWWPCAAQGQKRQEAADTAWGPAVSRGGGALLGWGEGRAEETESRGRMGPRPEGTLWPEPHGIPRTAAPRESLRTASGCLQGLERDCSTWDGVWRGARSWCAQNGKVNCHSAGVSLLCFESDRDSAAALQLGSELTGPWAASSAYLPPRASPRPCPACVGWALGCDVGSLLPA